MGPTRQVLIRSGCHVLETLQGCCRVPRVPRVTLPACRDASLLRSARDLDERDRRVAGLEGELAALRKALDDCQTRHTDQLARCVCGGI